MILDYKMKLDNIGLQNKNDIELQNDRVGLIKNEN